MRRADSVYRQSCMGLVLVAQRSRDYTPSNSSLQLAMPGVRR